MAIYAHLDLNACTRTTLLRWLNINVLWRWMLLCQTPNIYRLRRFVWWIFHCSKHVCVCVWMCLHRTMYMCSKQSSNIEISHETIRCAPFTMNFSKFQQNTENLNLFLHVVFYIYVIIGFVLIPPLQCFFFDTMSLDFNVWVILLKR